LVCCTKKNLATLLRLQGWLVNNYQTVFRNLFFLLVVLHLFEAVFAMMICTYMDFEYGLTLKWGLNVLVNGVFALR
jgi:hypothetical protein